MTSIVHVAIHKSQFPGCLERALRAALVSRRIDPKFHYASPSQSQAWLALHRACSPSAVDARCIGLYRASFRDAARRLAAGPVHLVSLGCGGGQKEARLVRLLRASPSALRVTLVDASPSLVLAAHRAIQAAAPTAQVASVVMDLAVAKELPAILPRSEAAQARRLVTCFGVLPNMQPAVLLPNLRRLLRERDLLLVSANLIPRPCQAPEAKALLRLYDNPATRDWLWLLLLDCGFEKADGELRFVLERVSSRLEWWQVIAFFCLRHDRVIRFGSKEVPFRAGETMRLFFSNRFTGLAFRSLLARHGLRVLADWRADQIDEGNFTCEREFS